MTNNDSIIDKAHNLYTSTIKLPTSPTDGYDDTMMQDISLHILHSQPWAAFTTTEDISNNNQQEATLKITLALYPANVKHDDKTNTCGTHIYMYVQHRLAMTKTNQNV